MKLKLKKNFFWQNNKNVTFGESAMKKKSKPQFIGL
jgi:hypothetical protein